MPKSQLTLPRTFFAIYAAGAFVMAMRLLTWRFPQYLPGAILIALGCALLPMCLLRSAPFPFLHTALKWNAGGLFGLAIELRAQPSPDHLFASNTAFAFAFFALAIIVGLSPDYQPLASTTVFGNSRPSRNLRSVYEDQIRAAAGQQERNRLARDLHDSIKQQIFAIQTTAAAAQARFDTDPPGAREALASVRASAREAMAEMEAMLDQLRASPLESVGLVEAVRKQCDALEYRTGAHVKLDVADIPAAGELPPGAAQSLFRIAQEALANIARHARATEVRVVLAIESGNCILKIKDNGAGFVPGNESLSGMGLSNMRSRAADRGGSLNIESNPGEGTRLLATIPLVMPEDREAAESLRKASLLMGAAILTGLLCLLVRNNFANGLALGLSATMGCSALALFVRWGHAATTAIRQGWLLLGLGLAVAPLTLIAANSFLLGLTRGLSAGLLIGAAAQLLSRSRG
jgi:signal transduction histidine kinase